MEAAVKHVRQEGCKNLIWIQEMVTKEEAIELYSHATVFCCPSIYEPFGIINLEAMACRTAVVASAVGGIKEVVVDGVTGLSGAARTVARRALRAGRIPMPSRAIWRQRSTRFSTTRNSPRRWPPPARSAPARSSAGRASRSKPRHSTTRWSPQPFVHRHRLSSNEEDHLHISGAWIPQDYPRVIIEAVASRRVDGGRFPIKRVVGEKVAVSADIYKEGHDKLAAVLKVRKVGEKRWQESPMTLGRQRPLVRRVHRQRHRSLGVHHRGLRRTLPVVGRRDQQEERAGGQPQQRTPRGAGDSEEVCRLGQG
jgi:hypothetical protein